MHWGTMFYVGGFARKAKGPYFLEQGARPHSGENFLPLWISPTVVEVSYPMDMFHHFGRQYDRPMNFSIFSPPPSRYLGTLFG